MVPKAGGLFIGEQEGHGFVANAFRRCDSKLRPSVHGGSSVSTVLVDGIETEPETRAAPFVQQAVFRHGHDTAQYFKAGIFRNVSLAP